MDHRSHASSQPGPDTTAGSAEAEVVLHTGGLNWATEKNVVEKVLSGGPVSHPSTRTLCPRPRR